MSRNADFTPSRGEYKSLTPFRYWCQKVLPLVYDDALSYYELLCKVVDYLNKTMEDTETLNDDVTNLYTAYQELQEWVNDYYESADFEQAIDAGLDRMAESGQLTALINAIIAPQLPDIVDLLLPETVLTLLPDEVHSQLPGVVEDQIDDVVEDQIGSTVAGQIGATVANQISPVVANQLPGVVSNQIDAVVAEEIVDPVEDWLESNVGTGIAVDRTLSIVGAGADAAFTGARLKTLDDVIGYEHVSDTSFVITTANPFAFNYGVINDIADFSDLGTHTYKMMVIPASTGDKFCINAHKISIANVSEDHFAVTYAFCAKYQPNPSIDTPRYEPTTYSADNAENVIAITPEIVIPTGQGYDETTGYLVVITANIEDPVYKVTEPEYLVNQDQLDDAIDEVSGALDAVSETVSGLSSDVASKADEDGTYPYMTVGMAEQLLSDTSVTDKKPYLFRRTGADATREFDTLVGGSVVNNQLYNKMFPQSNTVNGITFTVNDDGSITANGTSTNTVYYQISDYMSFNNHVAYLSGCPSGGSAETYRIYLDTTPFSDTGNGCIDKLTIESKRFFINMRTGVTVNNLVFRPQIIDLTKMFGSTIADYAYTLEQATAGSGIAWLKGYGFFDGYQAYNAGSMVHVSGVSEHVMTGFNQLDADTVLSHIGLTKQDDGSWYIASPKVVYNSIVWENQIDYHGPVCLSYEYKYASASQGLRFEVLYTDGTSEKLYTSTATVYTKALNLTNASKTVKRVLFDYGSIVGSWMRNICINLSNPAKNGQYEPYTVNSYTLDDTLTLRGIPKLSNGEIYYDGDVYWKDGTVTRRYASIDLGSLTWNKDTVGDNWGFYVASLPNAFVISANTSIAHFLTQKYDLVASTEHQTYAANGVIFQKLNGQVFIVDKSYSTKEDFKTAMNGVYLLYELATPTTESAEPYQSPQICDPDGTEQYITDGIPVGHDTQYPANLKGEIERIMVQVPKAPSANGVYTLQCTVSSEGVLYEWVENS